MKTDELVVNGEHTLLGYLHRLGQDNGADFDDGANGYFSWAVEGSTLSVFWRPYDYVPQRDDFVEGELVMGQWQLVRSA